MRLEGGKRDKSYYRYIELEPLQLWAGNHIDTYLFKNIYLLQPRNFFLLSSLQAGRLLLPHPIWMELFYHLFSLNDWLASILMFHTLLPRSNTKQFRWQRKGSNNSSRKGKVFPQVLRKKSHLISRTSNPSKVLVSTYYPSFAIVQDFQFSCICIRLQIAAT